ncbi:MAG: amidohydrolase family protein [Pirellulales bacterium]|nr:amidohydrolase family protein [Pirellulales bacterium]
MNGFLGTHYGKIRKPWRQMILFALAWLIVSLLLTVPSWSEETSRPTLAIKAARVHIGNGRTIDRPVILIQDGRIQAVGSDLSLPDHIQIIEIDGGSVTPGLIDANARLESADMIPASRKGPGQQGPGGRAAISRDERPCHDSQVPLHVGDEEDPTGLADLAAGVRAGVVVSEQGSEVVPHTRVLDSVNFCSSDFQRLVQGGVTTIYASPDASAVIGPRGAILKTAGPMDQRVLVAEAAVKATIGTEPNRLGSYNQSPYRNSVSLYTRRPNSRMGLTWVFRKAFHDAIRRKDGLVAYGADTSSPEASRVLYEVLEGKIPLRIQARIQQDIHTAIRLCDEFKLRFTLEEATEAYRCIESIQASAAPVIFGPIFERPNGIRAFNNESNRSRYSTFRALLEAGVPTSLSAQDLREEDGLARQAMHAMRFGVDFEDALKAVTQTPARMLGLDGQIGTIESGKQADLVVWRGQPFAATSMVVMVFIDGNIVVDRR